MGRIDDIIRGDMLFHLFHMELVGATEGQACVRAEVREEFSNAHSIAHGGMIFALLDIAFALAVNSMIDAVGVQWSFNIFRSAAIGDHVRAEARVIHRGRQSVVVEFRVESEETERVMAQGIATALPLPRKRTEGQ